MISRRQLFARLSAVAIAPLVKWLPKEEASIRFIACDVATGLDWSVTQVYANAGYWEMVESGALPDFRLFSPVPQEEA